MADSTLTPSPSPYTRRGESRYSFRPEFGWALIAVSAAAVISLALSLQAGVFALFFAIAAWWAWQHPWDSFIFLVILASILPMLKITQTIGTFTLIKDIIILTLFCRLFLLPLLQKKLPYRRNLLFAPIVALGLVTIFSLIRADERLLGILRARDIGLYVLLYFAVLYLPHSRKRRRQAANYFIASASIVLCLAVYQWFFAVDSAVLRFDPVREIWIPRLSSILAHPSIFGQYLVLLAAFCGAGAVTLVGKTRWLLAGLGVLTLPFIYLTYSRAVWIGLIAAGAVMGLAWLVSLARQRVPKRYLAAGSLAISIASGVILAGLLMFTPVGVFVRSAIDPTYGSNEERIEFAARLIAPLKNTEALIGRGLGDVVRQNFREIDLETIDLAAGAAREVQLTKNATLVDNQWLKTFVEMGLAGLLVYAWIFWRVGHAAWQSTGIIGLWAFGFLAAFVVQGFFIDIWDIFPTNAAFWIVAAMVSAASGGQLKKAPSQRQKS